MKLKIYQDSRNAALSIELSRLHKESLEIRSNELLNILGS